MEAVALFNGEAHSDKPQCASPVLTRFGIRLNDSFDEEYRQKLKAFIPKLVGSRNAALEERRVYFLVDRAVRLFAPMALRSAADALEARGIANHPLVLRVHAEKLEGFPEVTAYVANAAYVAADAAANAAYAANAAAAANAAYAAAYAADAAAYAANAAAAYAANAAAYAAADAAAYAADAAAYAADAAAYAARRSVWEKSIEVFGQAIEIVEVAV
jgi:hypothetical protein